MITGSTAEVGNRFRYRAECDRLPKGKYHCASSGSRCPPERDRALAGSLFSGIARKAGRAGRFIGQVQQAAGAGVRRRPYNSWRRAADVTLRWTYGGHPTLPARHAVGSRFRLGLCCFRAAHDSSAELDLATADEKKASKCRERLVVVQMGGAFSASDGRRG
jgi:hypothetical protein